MYSSNEISHEEQAYANLIKMKKIVGKIVVLSWYLFSTFVPFF